MMAVTARDVCLVYDTSLSEAEVNTMIATAETLIVTHIDPVSDPLVTTTVRDSIKTWLAAHFCAVSDPQTKEESADGIRTVFHGKSDLGLDATLYGQQVQMLDPTGKLSNLKTGVKRLRTHFSTPRELVTDP
jgi:hypothetical protein